VRRGTLAIASAPDDLGTAFEKSPQKPLAALSVVGTAFVVDPAGIAITAKHVIQPWLNAYVAHKAGKGLFPPRPKVAMLVPGQQAGDSFEWGFMIGSVTYIQTSNRLDIAALRFSPPPQQPLVPLPMAGSCCEDGDEVVTCGFPFGLELHQDQLGGLVLLPSFSQGIVSAALPYPRAPEAARTVFQLDAMMNGGNSGGPVVAIGTGEVVGIVTNALQMVETKEPTDPTSGSTQEVAVPTGLGRAVYIHQAQAVISELRKAVEARGGQAPLGRSDQTP
jgi:S1-C subfamily serine protease